MPGWGVSSSYLQAKKYKQVSRPTPARQIPAAPQDYEKIYIDIIEGGGRMTYSLKGVRATFFKTDNPKIYYANILTSQKSYFYSGRTFQLSCGCGGGKRTTGRVQ